MRRIVVFLFAAALACLLACAAVYRWQTRMPPEEWIGRRLGLTGEALRSFTEAHNRYASRCAEMCRKIREADDELSALILRGREFTPQMAAAMARADALRAECRQNMLRHFYEVAAMLESPARERYLRLVLPLIVEPGRMARDYHQPDHQP